MHASITRPIAISLLVTLSGALSAQDASVVIDTSAGGRRQMIDGFGTCVGSLGDQAWYQQLYYDDLGCSMMRMDLTPTFVTPFSDLNVYSPFFSYSTLYYPAGQNPNSATQGAGPDHNNVRTYTGPSTYGRTYGGTTAPIAVMGTDIAVNIQKLVFSDALGAMAKAGADRTAQLGGFKLYGSLWSPAPWLKMASGTAYTDAGQTLPTIMPISGTAYPFIWNANYAGGKLDASNTPLALFTDNSGTMTSALTQFARTMAATVKGFQDRYHVAFYGVSIQNELNFEEFYNSCTYPQSAPYLAAVKAVRAEFDRYTDLQTVRIIGPEDLLGGDAYGMYAYGSQPKNLQYLESLDADAVAKAAVDTFCVHGYANNGTSAAGADPTQWAWWANGWTTSPGGGLPTTVKGFTAYGKKSWMTETSGESAPWLYPTSGFPGNGGFSIALKIQQALGTGRESAWLYWQLATGDAGSNETLTGKTNQANEAKYVAAKHFFKYLRPGAQALATTVSNGNALTGSAFIHDADATVTVVLVNSSTVTQNAIIAVPAAPTGLDQFRVVTSRNGSLWQTSTPTVASGQITLSVPAYGVVTLVASRSVSPTGTGSGSGSGTSSTSGSGTGSGTSSTSGASSTGGTTTSSDTTDGGGGGGCGVGTNLSLLLAVLAGVRLQRMRRVLRADEAG